MKIKNYLFKATLLTFLLFPNCSSDQSSEYQNQIEGYVKNEFNDLWDNRHLVTYFNDLNWKNKLTSKDLSIINSAIDLGNYNYREDEANIMVPVLVHRLKSINDKKNLFRWEGYRKFLKETESFSDEEYDKFLLSNIQSKKLKKFNENIEHYRAIDNEILNALVIRQCRLLRSGKNNTVEIDKIMLNSFHQNALEQSQYPNQIAIQNLTYKISNLGHILSPEKYGILNALYGYSQEATLNTLGIIKNPNTLKGFSEKGKGFLLLHLLERAKIDLSTNEQEELIKYLSKKEIYTKTFKEDIHVICYIINRINGDDLVPCLEKLNKKHET